MVEQRQPPVKDKDWLAIVRQQPCCVCGGIGVDAHHPRIHGVAEDGKVSYPGGGQKCSDRWAVALCRRHHVELHHVGERLFWARLGIDPFAVALGYAKQPGLNYRMPE